MLDEDILFEIKQALFTSLSEKPAKSRASNALNIEILATFVKRNMFDTT